MAHIGTTDIIDCKGDGRNVGGRPISSRHSIMIIRDDDRNNDVLRTICEFLDIEAEFVSPHENLTSVLPALRPAAVIADLDGDVQDGYHVMKRVAKYDDTLPILLFAENDPALLGAVDAVCELWGLTQVATATTATEVGAVVDFLCHAARTAGRTHLMRT